MTDVEVLPATILAADPQYPLKMDYCAECSLPYEFCEYGPQFDKCKDSLKKNLPYLFSRLYLGGAPNDTNSDQQDAAQSEDKKRQKRGGKASAGKSSGSKKAGQEQRKVLLSRAPRGKNKFVTVVTGLGSYSIDLKVASKFFSQRFACGSSVTGADEIVIQGDVKDDLFDVLPEKFKDIDEDNIDDLGDAKR